MVKPWAKSVLLLSAGIVVGREGRQSEWEVFPAWSFRLGLGLGPGVSTPSSSAGQPPTAPASALETASEEHRGPKAPPRPAALLPNVRLFTTVPPKDRPPGADRQVIPMATAGLGGHSQHRKQDLWKLLPSHWTSSAKYTVFWHTPHFLPPPQFGILQVDTEKGMNFPGRWRPGWPRTGPGEIPWPFSG